ncbi:MAG: hypothetical protein AB1445_15225 [Bacillota bacterium]
MTAAQKPARARRGVVLHDVFFPIWIQYLVPLNLVRIAGVNYLVNALVVRLTLGILSVEHHIRSLLKYAGLATLLGLAADFAGLLVYDWLVRPHVPVSKAPVNWYLLTIVGVAAVLIFFANLLLARRLLSLTRRQSLLLALVMAVFTAPWLVLLDQTHLPKYPPPGMGWLPW